MLLASKQSTTKQLGKAGERAVGTWLQQRGFTILCYNYRSKIGEIDIIAQHNTILAFVEVKARTVTYFNSSELIIASKQKKIIQTAQKFCFEKNITDKIYRFDVALVQPRNDSFDITYIPNAFTKNHDY